MDIRLVLVPDFFIPRWSRGGDRAYLVLQPVLAQPVSGVNDAETDLHRYLKGFRSPFSGQPADPRRLVVSIQDRDGFDPDTDPIPVPLPDTIEIELKWRRHGQDVAVLPALKRDLRSFATLRSFAAYVGANRVLPRSFLVSRIDRIDGVERENRPNWWVPKAAPLPPQPDAHDGVSTYAEVLCQQLTGPSIRELELGRERGPRLDYENLKRQLGLAFGVGKPIRFADDDGKPLFEKLGGEAGSQLMIFPDLRPGEDWETAIQDPTRVHVNAHSLCGFVWPFATRDQIRGLDPEEVPDELVVSITAHGQDVATDPDGGTLSYPSSEALVGSNAVSSYLDALRGTDSLPAAPISVRMPEGLPADWNRLAFAINKSENLPQEAAFTEAIGAERTAFLFSSPPGALDAAGAEPFRPLRAGRYASLSLLASRSPKLMETEVKVDLLLAIPGRLSPYRKFRDPALGGSTPAPGKALLAFEAERPIPGAIAALLKARLEAGEAVRLYGGLEGGVLTQPVNASPLRVHAEEDIPDPNSYSRFGTYRPVFFFEDLPIDRLNAYQRLSFLVLTIREKIAGDWLPDPDPDVPGREAMLDSAQWRTRPDAWPASDNPPFNLIVCNLPPRPKSGESARPHPLGASLWLKDEFDFHLARSARHLWLPILASHPAVPPSAIEETEGGGEGEGEGGDPSDLEVDFRFDVWNHKQLNVYLKAEEGEARQANPESLGLSIREENPPVDGSKVGLDRYFAFFLQQEEDLLALPLKELLPDPPEDSPYKLAYPDWNRDWEPERPFRLFDPKRISKPLEIALGFEHQYGTRIFARPDKSSGLEPSFTPYIDWPVADPTRIRPKLDDGRQDRIETHPEEFFLLYTIEPGEKTDHVVLSIRADWLDADAGPEPSSDDRLLGAQARKAADELLRAARVSLIITGFRFNLERDQTDQGTGHDRDFRSMLEPIGQPIEKDVSGADLQEVFSGPPRESGSIRIDLESTVSKEASLVTCEIRVERPKEATPPFDSAALTKYRLFRPRLGQSDQTFLSAGAIVGEGEFARRFEPVAVDAEGGAFAAHLRSLRSFQGFVQPAPERTLTFRTGLTALMAGPFHLAPRGLAVEQKRLLEHALVPLAFLPVARHPVYQEATQEVLDLLLAVFSAYEGLNLAAFQNFQINDWKAFFKGKKDKLPLDGAREALARSLQPIAGAGMAEGLPAELAKAWRKPKAGPLTWPQAFALSLIRADWGVFAGAKALLVHALRGWMEDGTKPPEGPIPRAFHSLLVGKLAEEDRFPGGDGDDDESNNDPTIDRDEDLFTYRKTTTLRGGDVPEALVIGDLLDDLTYDNQFAVESVIYHSAEEFIETLGFPFSMDEALGAVLDDWTGTAADREPVFSAFDANEQAISREAGQTTVEALPRGSADPPRWLLTDLPSRREFLIVRDGARVEFLNVSLVRWRDEVFKLKDGVLRLPFGPPRAPRSRRSDGGENEPRALVPLIARRAAPRPTILFQGVLNGFGERSDDPLFLKDLESIAAGDPFPKKGETPHFKRAPDVLKSPRWKATPTIQELDAVIVSVLLTIEADEEDQLERDQVWLAQPESNQPPDDAEPPPKPRFDDALPIIRDKGPLAVPIATVRSWFEAGGGNEPTLNAWLVDLIDSGLRMPAGPAPIHEGTITFKSDGAEGAREGPSPDILTLEGGVKDVAARVSLFRPLASTQGDSRLPIPRIHVLAVELRLGAGDTYDALTFRQVRNEKVRLSEAGKEKSGEIKEFAPDPRFIIRTRSVVKPDPIQVVKIYDFEDEDKRGELRIPREKWIRIPTDPKHGLPPGELFDALEDLEFVFRNRNRVDRATIRITVDHYGVRSAPRLTYAGNRGTLLEGAGGHRRNHRKAELLFRFREPGVDDSFAGVYLPAGEAPSYRLEVICFNAMAGTGATINRSNTPFLTIRNIPVIPNEDQS